jgi:hypothetical protein
MKRYALMEQGDTALTECSDGDYYVASEVDARIAELEKDAARYRWLRSRQRLGHWRVQQWQVEGGEWNPDKGTGSFEDLAEDELDAAIDENISLMER